MKCRGEREKTGLGKEGKGIRIKIINRISRKGILIRVKKKD